MIGGIVNCHVCGEPAGDTGITVRCENCDNIMCEDCQAPYDQFSQIDYNCCTDCYESMKWGAPIKRKSKIPNKSLSCDCGAKHTSTPDIHLDWCSLNNKGENNV